MEKSDPTKMPAQPVPTFGMTASDLLPIGIKINLDALFSV